MRDGFTAWNRNGFRQSKSPINGYPKKDLARQIGDVERAYGGIRAWQREVEAQNTKLSYEYWLVARTSDFKAQFGDWEARRGVARIESSPLIDLSAAKHLQGKEEIKESFKSFGTIRNNYDQREIVFPTSVAGKVNSHKGFAMRSIAHSFDILFKKSVPMLSELEEIRENHKVHDRNIEGYSHYIRKFRRGSEAFYVRFTVQHLRDGQPREGQNQFHSAFVSSVSVYGYSADTPSSVWGQVNLVITESSANITRYDRKLATWLAAGKAEIAPSGRILEAREPTEPEIIRFLDRQNFRIPYEHITLPLNSESEKLIRLANEVRKLGRKPHNSPEWLRAAESLENALNSVGEPGLTAILLKRLLIAFSMGKCSEKKLRKAALAHDQAKNRRLSFHRRKEIALGNSQSIEL